MLGVSAIEDHNVGMTLGAILERAAEKTPERGVFFVAEDATAHFQPYPHLLEQAAGVLAGLRRAGLRAGDKLILALSRNQELVPAFWACILGGIIPAPLASPGLAYKAGPALERLLSVFRVLGEPKVLLDALPPGRGPSRDDLNGPVSAASLLAFAELLEDHPVSDFHQAQPGDPAFIQFSSGSTGRERRSPDSPQHCEQHEGD